MHYRIFFIYLSTKHSSLLETFSITVSTLTFFPLSFSLRVPLGIEFSITIYFLRFSYALFGYRRSKCKMRALLLWCFGKLNGEKIETSSVNWGLLLIKDKKELGLQTCILQSLMTLLCSANRYISTLSLSYLLQSLNLELAFLL